MRLKVWILLKGSLIIHAEYNANCSISRRVESHFGSELILLRTLDKHKINSCLLFSTWPRDVPLFRFYKTGWKKWEMKYSRACIVKFSIAVVETKQLHFVEFLSNMISKARFLWLPFSDDLAILFHSIFCCRTKIRFNLQKSQISTI